MTGNTSATGGPLGPEPTFGLDSATPVLQGLDAGALDGQLPLEDDDLADFLQALVAGLSTLPGTVVFPRWQLEPPNLPDVGTNWAAIGIVDRTTDVNAVELHNSDLNNGRTGGFNELRRHEIIETLTSFYGPNAGGYAARMRDMLQVAQNREVLTLNGMGLVETGSIRSVPALVKEQWLYRVDLPVFIRRQIKRELPVLHLLEAQVGLKAQEQAGLVINTTLTIED